MAALGIDLRRATDPTYTTAMDITCETCGAKIPSANVNVSTMIAKCDRCQTVFDFTSQVNVHRNVAPAVAPPKARPEVPMPPGIRVERDGTGGDAFAGMSYRQSAGAQQQPLTIHRRWFSPTDLFLLVFAAFWDSFIIVFYLGILKSGAPLFAALFPLIHLGVGVALTYRAIAGLLNTTTIDVKDGSLRVRHHPLPWRGNRSVPIDSITQLYCTSEVRRNKRGTMHTYDVHVSQSDGTSFVLVRGLPKLDQGLFIEQEVEKALGIKDVHVAGEVDK